MVFQCTAQWQIKIKMLLLLNTCIWHDKILSLKDLFINLNPKVHEFLLGEINDCRHRSLNLLKGIYVLYIFFYNSFNSYRMFWCKIDAGTDGVGTRVQKLGHVQNSPNPSMNKTKILSESEKWSFFEHSWI